MATSPQFPVRGWGSDSGKAEADEARLMERICDGDEPSLILIYDRYARLAYTLALHVLRDPSVAEDIVQEVFLKLWREPKTYDCNRGSVSTWIAINSRHRAVDYWRKHRLETQMPEGLELVDLSWAPSAYFPHLGKMLHSLSASQRDILLISYFGGFSHSEIALQTGLPLGTVKSKIRQALQAIKSQVLPQSLGLRKNKSPQNDSGL